MLRAAGGFTRRANSCLPLASPGVPLAEAVAAVERWYDLRGLVPAFQVPTPIGMDLDEYLDAAGWPAAAEDVLVMVASVEAVAAGRQTDVSEVAVADVPDAAWLGAYHYRAEPARGCPPGPDERRSGRLRFGGPARQPGGGRAGSVSDAPDGRRWLGVTAVEVAPHARRQGLGRLVMAGIAVRGRQRGATDVYVQVAEPNTEGMAVYERLGFTEHHRYHYRRRPPRS